MKILMCLLASVVKSIDAIPLYIVHTIFPVMDQFVYMHWLTSYILVDLADDVFHLTGIRHGSKRMCGLFLFAG